MKIFFKKFNKSNKGRQILSLSKGFTLVETLVAISIFTGSILGLMSVLASGISNTNYAKQKMIASYLAQEGIECIRNTRDTYVLYPPANSTASARWSEFRGLDFSNANTIICPNIGAGFTRILSKNTTGLSADEVKILSTVSWTQGSGNYSITFSESLFNWFE